MVSLTTRATACCSCSLRPTIPMPFEDAGDMFAGIPSWESMSAACKNFRRHPLAAMIDLLFLPLEIKCLTN